MKNLNLNPHPFSMPYIINIRLDWSRYYRCYPSGWTGSRCLEQNHRYQYPVSIANGCSSQYPGSIANGCSSPNPRPMEQHQWTDTTIQGTGVGSTPGTGGDEIF